MLGIILVGLLSQAPFATLELIKVQQQQVDLIQARLDGPSERYERANIDYLNMSSPGTLSIGGWAVTCDPQGPSKIVIMMDGVQTGQAQMSQFTRYDRSDVRTDPGLVQMCASMGSVMSYPAGFFTLLDIAPFGPGPRGDNWHKIKVRIFNSAGKMQESPTLDWYGGSL